MLNPLRDKNVIQVPVFHIKNEGVYQGGGEKKKTTSNHGQQMDGKKR